MSQNNKPLVSVIIPTYNAGAVIDRCLTSVVNQTYTNLQIICCDDCSSDDTYQKLLAWTEKDSRITVMQNEVNSRAAFSRNRCIKIAEGKYVAQIDDDDYCVPYRIERQVCFLEAHPEYDFLGTGAYYFDENGVWGETDREKSFAPAKEDFLFNACFMNPTMMYRKKTLETVGGYRIARETRRGQDYDMHMRMYAAGLKGYILADRLTYYYRGKNSFPKCKYEYRIDEAKIRWINYKAMGLLPKGIPFVIKPLIVGLIPISVIEAIKCRLGTNQLKKAETSGGKEGNT